MEGYNNVFENSIYNFNKYINENNSLDLLFSDFYLHDDKFRFIHNGDKVPDLEAIKIANKINSKLYEKYIEINNNKKMIGHSSVTIPVDNIYNELDSRHIMMSIILFDYLSKNNIDIENRDNDYSNESIMYLNKYSSDMKTNIDKYQNKKYCFLL